MTWSGSRSSSRSHRTRAAISRSRFSSAEAVESFDVEGARIAARRGLGPLCWSASWSGPRMAISGEGGTDAGEGVDQARNCNAEGDARGHHVLIDGLGAEGEG